MNKFIKGLGASVLEVLILVVLIMIMVAIPSIILNYILISLGVSASIWLSVAIVGFMLLISIMIKNI